MPLRACENLSDRMLWATERSNAPRPFRLKDGPLELLDGNKAAAWRSKEERSSDSVVV